MSDSTRPKVTGPCDAWGGIDPPPQLPERKWINVNGREEHEAILRDPKKCQELGLDIIYETIVYLKRWGAWLSE